MTTLCGYILTKKDLFGAVAAKGASQLLLNVFIPALLFSKIIPGFTTQNIGALATAVIMTITASAPFSDGDLDTAVAYISIFILVGYTALFPLGGHRLIAKDFANEGESADADETPESVASHLRNSWAKIRAQCGAVSRTDVEKNTSRAPIDEKGTGVMLEDSRSLTKDDCSEEFKEHVGCVEYLKRDSSGSTDTDDTTARDPPVSEKESPPTLRDEGAIPPTLKDNRFRRVAISVWKFVVALAIPPTISIVLGIVVAIIPTLKALFIPLPADSNVHVGMAPDGLPPLHVIFDTATFIGGASIPLGLVCLGSALARLEVPKPFRTAPLGAITAFSLLK
ncbi:Protein M3, partial [Ceratobasidium sp. 395]